MYSRKSWGGDVDPFILAKFAKANTENQENPETDPVVSLVIFEWNDESLIGKLVEGPDGKVR
jgi:hypothetical protein